MYPPCFKCKKDKIRKEHHHITYDPPEEVTLCQNPCHNKITELNTLVARCLAREITNEERCFLWKMFLDSPLNTLWQIKKGKGRGMKAYKKKVN